MPEKKTRARALEDKKEGKSASTQAGEYVREQMDHVGEGKHAARTAKQAIAIGLSEARRDGVKATPARSASAATKKKAAVDSKAAAKKSTAKKAPAKRSASKKAARTKGASGRSAAAKKGARTWTAS